MDHYIGKEFTFVVSWISETATATQESQSKQRGIFVIFRTQNIYYPLLPTSVYGSEVIPATIRIIGHRSPKIFEDIKNFTEAEYFIDYSVSLVEGLEKFYNGPTKKVKYTKIEIKAPSKFLTDDLWIRSSAPLKTYYSSFVAQYAFFCGAILLILISIISSLIAGWIVFRDLRDKNGILKLALVGLSNCLFIIGLVIATVLFKTKAKDENVVSLLNEIRQKGYIWKRRLATVLLIVDIPFLIITILILLINLYFAVFILILLIASVAVLAFALFIKRIKAEDKSLFAQLKSANYYTSWLFNPKDRMKLAFVPLFSASFLIISWLVVKIIELTV